MWSPDSLWLAYFSHTEADIDEGYFPHSGLLHFYNPETGITCDYPDAAVDILFENGETRPRNTWLRDGKYLNLTGTQALIITPCESAEDIADSLPQPPGATSIVAYSLPLNTLMLRTTVDGFSLLNLDTGESQRLEGDINSFNFYGGLGSVSPSGTRFAFTLSGPGDSYVVDIETGAVTIVVDEPLSPGEDECCTTPRVPQWLSPDWLMVSTQSMGPSGGYGQVLVNVADGTLITSADISSDPEFYIDAAYWETDNEEFVVWLRNQRGNYGVASSYRLEMTLAPDKSEIDELPEGVTVMLTGRGWQARGRFEDFAPIMDLRTNGLPSFAASVYRSDIQRLAVGGDQFISIYDVLTGDWVEVIAPSGYIRFRVGMTTVNSGQWSMDSHHLAMTAMQQRTEALLVATIDELPRPATTPQG